MSSVCVYRYIYVTVTVSGNDMATRFSARTAANLREGLGDERKSCSSE